MYYWWYYPVCNVREGIEDVLKDQQLTSACPPPPESLVPTRGQQRKGINIYDKYTDKPPKSCGECEGFVRPGV